MATILLGGPRKWSGSVDSEGNRTYKVTYQVEGATTDGPANVLQTPGLPVTGSWWIIDDDVDLWAWCRAERTVTQRVENEPNTLWEIEFTFSTKPPDPSSGRKGDGGSGSNSGCSDNQIEDPLLEPQKVSGTFVKKTEEKALDRFGDPIVNSAWEGIKGPPVEFDSSKPQVRIEQNVPFLQLALFAEMIDTVNDSPLWGLPARCIKLSNVSWERKFYGTCYVYYTRVLEFDISFSTFDRHIIDEATKILNGHWGSDGTWHTDPVGTNAFSEPIQPDYNDPTHFHAVQDKKGNPTKYILNGRGVPWDNNMATTGTADDLPGDIYVEYYGESNFLLLGIPLVF